MKIQLPSSVLLVIDIQSRLMPAIANEKEVVVIRHGIRTPHLG